jgi:hypothetical protein
MARKSQKQSATVSIYLTLEVFVARGVKHLQNIFLDPGMPLLTKAAETARAEGVRDWVGFSDEKVTELVNHLLEEAKAEKDIYRRRGMYGVARQIKGLQAYKAKAGNKAQYRLTAVLQGHSRRNQKPVAEAESVAC